VALNDLERHNDRQRVLSLSLQLAFAMLLTADQAIKHRAADALLAIRRWIPRQLTYGIVLRSHGACPLACPNVNERTRTTQVSQTSATSRWPRLTYTIGLAELPTKQRWS